jgi:hypothetical protein
MKKGRGGVLSKNLLGILSDIVTELLLDDTVGIANRKW